MVTVAKLNAQRKASGLPLVRYEIRKLSEEDLIDLREAYKALYDISEAAEGDSRGYWALARGHGYDQALCHNDNRIFLTWHRAYVYAFEKALSEAFKTVRDDEQLELTLPYWDWTIFDPANDADNGIPNVINEDNYTDRYGSTQPNPLKRAKSLYRIRSLSLSGEDEYTTRYPSQFRAQITELADDVSGYMGIDEYMTFNNDFDRGAHGLVHVFVGGGDPSSPLPNNAGDMSRVVSAAFDPIFWLHHCMVDKVFYDWQAMHPSANVPEHVRSAVIYDSFTGNDVLDAETNLRYVYSSEAPIALSPEPIEEQEEEGEVATVEIPALAMESPVRSAKLDFHQLKPPIENYILRVYIDNPQADARTPRTDPSFAGQLVLFGHGECYGGPGHCNPNIQGRGKYDLRRKHPLRNKSTRYSINITKALNYVRQNGSSPHTVRLIAINGNGEQAPVRNLRFTNFSIVID
ncbi:MAG: tyrosinase family protein [Leptolyngbyaceae cyanobacterium MO_188.B28]|nr:tyrosinase family protein [Leptolyngbyaceae cyanobacterium MO_188.B28]